MAETTWLAVVEETPQEIVKQAWQDVVVQGRPAETAVRAEVIRSWRRCRKQGIDPFKELEPSLPPDVVVDRLLEKNRELIEAAGPIMDMTAIAVRGSGFITTLADKDGYVLKVCGDDDIMALAASNGYKPGCLRSESFAGTNSIGLCLTDGRPCQITGAEHYRFMHHPWTCSSAPIFVDEGHLIGAVTLSGRSIGRHRHTLALVISAAENIARALREKQLMAERQRLNGMLTSVYDSISEGVVALGDDLSVSHMNRTAREQLGLADHEVVGRPLGSLARPDERLAAALRAKRYSGNLEATFLSPAGARTFLCTVAPIAAPAGQAGGVVLTMDERRKVVGMVKRIGGSFAKFVFDDIKGRDPRLLQQMELARSAARTDSRVLIMGESGTGKELFAQAIHNHSHRRHEPFVAISCAAIPRDLIEAELFGYREGAFTGARKGGQMGKFEVAEGGTLFLDEIHGLPLELQAKLLRVLQQREIVRLGDSQAIPVDVRVISAGNMNLLKMVNNGDFREDLYYRLNVVEVVIPPLRERKVDLPLLCGHILGRVGQEMKLPVPELDAAAVAALDRYHWPGNVRELENCLERAVLLGRGRTIGVEHLPERLLQEAGPAAQGQASVRDAVRSAIEEALSRCRGNVSLASRELRISRSTLYRKMRDYGIQPLGPERLPMGAQPAAARPLR